MTAAARKLPTPQQDAPKQASMYDFIASGLEGVDVEGFVQAAKKYGDDHERELADIQAGCHPLQRRRRAR